MGYPRGGHAGYWGKSRRYFSNLSLLIIDLDNFKQYNDSFGHQKGDELLKKFTVLLKSSIRSPDFVARYGGDEFVIVMVESDRAKALQLAERVCKKIHFLPLNKTASDAYNKVTASIGIATFPTKVGDIEELFKIADSSLYKEKMIK